MVREFNAIYEMMLKLQVTMRTAAYVHALNRLGKAMEAQGTRSYFTEKMVA